MNSNIETGAAIVKAPSDADRTPTELATIVRDEIQNCRKALSDKLEHAMNAGDVGHALDIVLGHEGPASS